MSPAILRILDVNSNRVREALRVLEDYARFHEDDADLSGALKALRHDFQIATATLQAQAIAARDTAGDVGTGITTQTEQTRESLAAVVTAAAKRLGEALRTVEEYAKLPGVETRSMTNPFSPQATADPALPIARQIERIRYRWYDLEKSILLRLAPGRQRLARVRLHVLVSESLCRRPWLETVERAIVGGAGVIQLREKTLDARLLLQHARQLVELCRRHGVMTIINDRPDIALLAGADGVHVGQDDLPLAEARKLLGPGMIVGVSTHTIEQARAAAAGGADYIGVGPIFPSTTKPKESLAGLAYAREAAALPLPTVGISGIAVSNVAEARATGLTGVAVSSAVCQADDPAAAATALCRTIDADRAP